MPNFYIGGATAAGIPAAGGAAIPGAALGAAGISPLLATAVLSTTALVLVAGLGTAVAIFPPNSFPNHQVDAFSVIFREGNGKGQYHIQ